MGGGGAGGARTCAVLTSNLVDRTGLIGTLQFNSCAHAQM